VVSLLLQYPFRQPTYSSIVLDDQNIRSPHVCRARRAVSVTFLGISPRRFVPL
jgi:hypothetical protein